MKLKLTIKTQGHGFYTAMLDNDRNETIFTHLLKWANLKKKKGKKLNIVLNAMNCEVFEKYITPRNVHPEIASGGAANKWIRTTIREERNLKADYFEDIVTRILEDATFRIPKFSINLEEYFK